MSSPHKIASDVYDQNNLFEKHVDITIVRTVN